MNYFFYQHLYTLTTRTKQKRKKKNNTRKYNASTIVHQGGIGKTTSKKTKQKTKKNESKWNLSNRKRKVVTCFHFISVIDLYLPIYITL